MSSPTQNTSDFTAHLTCGEMWRDPSAVGGTLGPPKSQQGAGLLWSVVGWEKGLLGLRGERGSRRTDLGFSSGDVAVAS